MDKQAREIAGRAERFKKLYTAAVYDIMDEMGLPNQCLDLGIRALDRSMRIAGPAFTVAVTADMRSDDEYDLEEVKALPSSAVCIRAVLCLYQRPVSARPGIGAS